MIAPTKMYDSFPTISPEEAADLVCEAIRAKPKQINTKLGTFGEVAYALAPKAVDQILHLAYRVFPESTAAKGGKGDGERQGVGRGDRARLSDEGRALVVLTAAGSSGLRRPRTGWRVTALTHRGEELLGGRRATACRTRRGRGGIPLLHPWANRLGGFGYTFDGEAVALAPARPTSASRSTGCRCTGCARRSRLGATVASETAPRRRPRSHAGLAEFPFDHRARGRRGAEPSRADASRRRSPRARGPCRSRSATTRSSGCPACRAPSGRSRCRWRTQLPLDERLVPTGERVAGRRPRRPARRRARSTTASRSTSWRPVRAAGRRAPDRGRASRPATRTRRCSRPRIADVVCFEPMTAPADALRHAPGAVAPGETFTARFSCPWRQNLEREGQSADGSSVSGWRTARPILTGHGSRLGTAPCNVESNRYRLPASAVGSTGWRGPSLGRLHVEVLRKDASTCVGPHGPRGRRSRGPLARRCCLRRQRRRQSAEAGTTSTGDEAARAGPSRAAS